MTTIGRTWPRAVAALALIGVNACASAQGEPDAEAQAASDTLPAVTKIVNVTMESVELTSFTDFIRITGEVEAASDVTISAEETGAVIEFAVEKGRRVRRGQVIARLDASVLAAQVAEARAAAALAQEQYERQRRLWEDEQIGSEIAYLQARYQAEMQQARLQTLEARLAKTRITAPISGIFDEKYVEIGEMAAAGTPVVRVVALDRVKITGGVPERFAPFVDRGDRALISFDILPGREVWGEISFVGSSVDDRNRTFPVEVMIDNPDGAVKPQMVANVQLERTNRSDVVVIPQEVVVRTENGYQVYLIETRDGTEYASARSVTLGPAYADRVVIEEGLAVGDRLIVAGVQLVDDGNRVRIVGGPGE